MTYNQKTILYLSLLIMLLTSVSLSFMLSFKNNKEITQVKTVNSVVHSMLIIASNPKTTPPKFNKKVVKPVLSNIHNLPPVAATVSAPVVLSALSPTRALASKLKLKKKKADKKLDKVSNLPARLLPVLVIYEDELVIEFPKKIATSRNIKRAVARVLLSKNPQREKNLLTKKSFNLKNTPYFYKKIADQDNYPIRYPSQAYKYANFILENMAEDFSAEEGDFVLVHIPLIQSNIRGVAKNYESWVEDYGDEFGIRPSLIYAIMETESAFNPKAVSKSNAIGLMQLKLSSAGKDVHNRIDNKLGSPKEKDLFNSKNNIRMGTAYLSLLTNDYLSDVENEKIKEMMSISSYNGGLSTVLGLFGENSKKAISKVNRMNPKQVYNKLRFEHKSLETRNYLDKVLKADSKYKDLLNIPFERY